MNTQNKTIMTLAIVFVLTFSTILSFLPSTSAHTPPWSIPTYAKIAVSPDPVGLGQNVYIVMWIDKLLPTAVLTNDIRFHDYKLVITRPDGTTETKNYPIVTDTTSAQFTLYTPNQIGTYKFEFSFPGQVYTWVDVNQNDTFLPSSAQTTLTVQQTPVSSPPTYPLPTTYWTRPIEGQNTQWANIASNWLVTPALYNFQPDGTAPNSAHVMWTKPLEFGGVAGGSVGVSGAMYYNGMSYEGRFGAPIVMQGRLYYGLPLSNNNRGSGYVCVNLQTGTTLWTQTYNVDPTFGQLYWYDSPNQHGVLPSGYLWAVSGTTWMAYDGMTGLWVFNLTDVPAGANVYGKNGEIVRYILGGGGTWLACWNNTAAQGLVGGTAGAGTQQWRPVSKIINASAAYSWNVTLSQAMRAGSTINYAVADDFLLGSVGAAAFTNFGNMDPYTIFSISLKPSSRGQILWVKNYPAPANNISRQFTGSFGGSPLVGGGAFITLDKETSAFNGFSLTDGSQLWGPVTLPRAYNYYSATLNSYDAGAHVMAYGNLYACGYGGIVYCIDALTGHIKWTYGNGGEGNSTNSGVETPWGYYPTYVTNIADGKIYLFTSEHSPNSPLYKGALLRAVDAYTGKELWKISGWLSSGSFYSQAAAMADGYMTYFNTYDGQIYCVGKGPSATTLNIANDVVAKGQSLMIKGTVTDISAGAKAKVASGEFNIVPAMSDADMGSWMEYIYMQKPMPTNALGVPVTIFATDSNGNTEQIAQVTSDNNGMFFYKWTPTREGSYKITAVFEGSNSYWPSSAETAVGVDPAQAVPTAQPTAVPTATPTPTSTPAPTESVTPSPVPTSTSGSGIGTEVYIAIVAVVIIIVVIAIAVALRRRK